MRQAAARVGGVSRSPLQRAVTTVMETLRKAGMEGYDAPSQGRGLDLPIPTEGSKQRNIVERVIS